MHRFRLWLARKLIPDGTIVSKVPELPFTTTSNMTWTNGSAAYATAPTIGKAFDIIVNECFEEDEMGKKKKRSKAAGKAAAKNKQENRQKAKGGKGAR